MRVLVLTLLAAAGGSGQGQQKAAAPKLSQFDVAALRVDASCREGGFEGPTPNRLNFRCVHMRDLIQVAYGAFSNSKLNPRQIEVLGGPAWLDSELYDLTAKANAPLYQMAGPMLQALLQDRCKLKVRRETREVPVYALTVTKGGVKMQPSREGRCTPPDFSGLPPQPTPGQPQPIYCGVLSMGGNLATRTLSAYGMTMAEFSGRMLAGRVDRPVIDKTGLVKFDIDLRLEMRRTGRESDAARRGRITITERR